MTGSYSDAEDLVQETYLRAWRGFATYGTGAFRSWFYRIATHACLDYLSDRIRKRRWLPHQRSSPSDPSRVSVHASAEDVPWLEPYPEGAGSEMVDTSPDPEAYFWHSQTLRLSFMAALHYLSPRQRAVLILCDVLDFTPHEVSDLLAIPVTPVRSLLQRARSTLEKHRDPLDEVEPLADASLLDLLDRYCRAWEQHDVEALVAILQDDARMIMPPLSQWIEGRGQLEAFFRAAWTTCAGLKLVPARINGQPAFRVWMPGASAGEWRPHSLQVLSVGKTGIRTITAFLPPLGTAQGLWIE